jgi:hypothetical protein
MSTPIKGPGGASPGAGLPESEGPAGTKAGGTSETFREALEGAEGAEGAQKAGDSQGAGRAGASQIDPSDPVALVAADLRAGRIDVNTALDRIVERAMASGPATALEPAARRELQDFLRQALADDPSLLALTKDLERGR